MLDRVVDDGKDAEDQFGPRKPVQEAEQQRWRLLRMIFDVARQALRSFAHSPYPGPR